MFSSTVGRTGIELPLLDVIDSEEYVNKTVIPLPSSHLPDELSTPFVYGMQFDRPIYKLLMEHAIEGEERIYGHVAYRPDPDSLVGAIGCAAQVLIQAPTDQLPDKAKSATIDPNNDESITVVSRGSFRFVVKEVLKTFPYPLAIVDELVDDTPITSTKPPQSDEDKDDDDDEKEEDDDLYTDMEPPELAKQIIMGLRTLVKQQLESTSNLSPLEKAILQDSGAGTADYTEEMAAVLDVFVSSLIDICPTPIERYFTIGIMAGEIANVSNEIRKAMLISTDGVARLRLVLKQVQERVAMAQARKLSSDITKEVEEDQAELKVGTPELPPWARQIKKGTRLEYYWNEEYGWCGGVVVEDPVLILDELVLAVMFDDGETHKLPFRGEEKVRWRPGQDS